MIFIIGQINNFTLFTQQKIKKKETLKIKLEDNRFIEANRSTNGSVWVWFRLQFSRLMEANSQSEKILLINKNPR